MTVQLLLLLCMYGPIAAMGSCSIAPFGTAVITGDCVLSNQIIVIGTLNVTGIPDSQGNLPKIIGAGSNRFFKVEAGGHLILQSLNLTGGHVSGASGGAVHVSGALSKLVASGTTFANNFAT